MFFGFVPTACAVGCILAPLRGWLGGWFCGCFLGGVWLRGFCCVLDHGFGCGLAGGGARATWASSFAWRATEATISTLFPVNTVPAFGGRVGVSRNVHRSFVGRPSLCDGLRFLRMTICCFVLLGGQPRRLSPRGSGRIPRLEVARELGAFEQSPVNSAAERSANDWSYPEHP